MHKCKLYECKDEVCVFLRCVSKTLVLKRTTAECYSKEVAQFVVVNKPYDKLFAISLSETQSSLDTSFWSAEVKRSLLYLLYAIRTLHACN